MARNNRQHPSKRYQVEVLASKEPLRYLFDHPLFETHSYPEAVARCEDFNRAIPPEVLMAAEAGEPFTAVIDYDEKSQRKDRGEVCYSLPVYVRPLASRMGKKNTYEPHLILIDGENVMPQFDVVIDGQWESEIILLLGVQQRRSQKAIHKQMDELPNQRSRIIRLPTTGKNALDFHIAYLAGRSFRENTRQRILIVSKDGGYDPLVQYCRERGLDLSRTESLKAVFVKGYPLDSHVDWVMDNIKGNDANLPVKHQQLMSAIGKQIGDRFSLIDARKITRRMETRGLIRIKNGQVTFTRGIP